MNDLFKKLNVLIKAGLNDIVSSEQRTSRPPAHLGGKLDDDVQTLRERINDAVQYEDDMKARIRQMEAEIARWDRQADEAITGGNDAGARYAVEQMQRARQRVTMAQSDLIEHQRATQELIGHVNTLDAVVADARRSRTADAPEAARLPDLGNVLREARATITSLADTAAAQRDIDPPAQHDEAAIDDDLERRRQRLSKR